MDYLDNICRICLTGGTMDIDCLLINIFQPQEDVLDSNFSAAHALLVLCGVMVTEEDPYPKHICSVCHSRLEEAFRLRELAQKSQEVLDDMLSKVPDAEELPSEDLDESKPFEQVEYLEGRESVEAETEHDPIGEIKRESEIIIEEIIDYEQVDDIDLVYCCGCSSSFETELELRKHSIRKHRPKEATDVAKGLVQCNVCYATLSSEYKLSLHKRGKNNVQPLRKCEFCGCNFFSEDGLTQHKADFHSNMLYKCCGCTFTSLDRQEFLYHSGYHKIDPSLDEDTNKFQCGICFCRFETLQQTRIHQRFPYRKVKTKSDEITLTMLRCCGCPRVFSSIFDLRTHQEEVHVPQRKEYDPDLPTECSGCFRRFRNNAMLKKHHRRAADKKLFACSKCSVARRTLKELIDHEASHTGGGAFICCGCREGFESQEALEEHSRTVHANRPKVYYNDEEDTERPFECNICYRRYKSARDLRGHQRFVYYEKVHTCDVCGKAFAQENSLTIHMATHKTSAEFPCPVCGKKYKHESNVRNCVVRHERPKNHTCKICNVSFPGASNLYSHMISHSEDRRYKCDICQQSFKRSFHLRKHKNTHTSEKNYPCKYCTSKFCSTTELYKHEIKHTGLYPYQCELCNKKLTTRQVFIKHYESHIEDSAKVFSCHLCPLRYSKDHFLSNHIKYNHRIEPQDKNWNEKFNRQGPNRLKGGARLAGVRGVYSNDAAAAAAGSVPDSLSQEEIVEMMCEEEDEQLEAIGEEIEVQVDQE